MEKMTNAKALAYAIENGNFPTEVVEKLTKMLEQTQKKSSAERKPTATQTANLGFKSAIVDAMEPNMLYTITDLIKSVPAIADLSNQRVSAIVRQLKDEGLVERIEDKRKAYFRVVVSE